MIVEEEADDVIVDFIALGDAGVTVIVLVFDDSTDPLTVNVSLYV